MSPAHARLAGMIYTLTKVPDGPRKVGSLSQSLVPREDGQGWVSRENARPTVGEQLLVGAPFRIDPDVAGVRITSPVKCIVSDEEARVVFETESGALYEWTRSEQH